MKLLFIMLIALSSFCYASESKAQEVFVTFNKSSLNVQDVLDEIEQQTDYSFFYNNTQIDTDRKVLVKKNTNSVFTLLTNIFEETDISYKVMDKNIILSKRDILKETALEQKESRKITGQVIDAKGIPIIGASIMVEGGSVGAITNVEGQFTLNISTESKFKVSYLGYYPQQIALTSSSSYEIVLVEDQVLLKDVVVTALGIKREEKALGYAVQKVKIDDLTSVKGVDLATSLTGKIAGLNIMNSTEFYDSPKIRLRGESPLLVVDGVPYGNLSLGEIPADDILSIDVLKGATASALYGVRGATGAIMVTTKKGSAEAGLDIEINSNTMAFAGYLAFPQVQSSYSRGYGGKYSDDYVWGDKLDIGRTAIQYDPYTYEWKEMPLVSKGKDNYKNFLQSSFVTNNNVSVSQTGKFGSVRGSMTHVYHKGQYPNQDMNKGTFSLGGTMTYQDFTMDAGLAYNKNVVSNSNGSGYSSSYIYDIVIWGGTEYDVRDYKNYWVKGKENVKQNWYDDRWYDNPWFKAHEVIDSYDNDVMNGYVNMSYQITPWLKGMLRGGVDAYTKKNKWWNAVSANYASDKLGFFGIKRNSGFSANVDGIMMADKTWGKFSLDGLLGVSTYYYTDDNIRSTTSGGLSVPGFYSLNASVDPAKTTSGLSRKQLNSVYSKLSLSWASTYYIDLTGRNDWSSTLSSDERSYFYPSVSGSFVFSEVLPLPDFVDFGKIRGSWTVSKADAAVYGNNSSYTITPDVWDGLGTAAYPSTLVGAPVNPKKSETIELGIASNFFGNRLFFDFAYYRKVESDFIISGGLSEATGYSRTYVNFKEERLRNGYELTIGGTPVKTTDFRWDVLTNWGHDKYSYQKIDPDYSTKRDWVAKGQSWNWLDIYDWDRDPQGNIIHNGGVPVKQEFKSKVGNTTPDLVWGISNTFKYKQFTLNVGIDGRIGGLSFSRTHQMLWNSGVHEDSDNQWRYEEVVNGNKTYIGKGVKVTSGTIERDAVGKVISDTRVFAPNDVVVSYEEYITRYHDSTNKPSRQNMLDETFFKIRNLSLLYDLPTSLCEKMKMKKASVGLTGQNLFLWAKDYKYADPDKGGDGSGYENLNSPSQRYVGVNIKVNF